MQKLNLSIRRGATVNLPIRIESDELDSVAITAITRSTPVRITATGHGLDDRWRAAVVCAGGMTEINASEYPPPDDELQLVTVVDANTVEFNKVSSACYRAYTSGGSLVSYAPLELSSFDSARMEVKDRAGGAQLALLTTGVGTLEIDLVTNTLWIRLTAAESAALTFKRGVFDIELVTLAGEVTPVCSAESVLTILDEITTDH